MFLHNVFIQPVINRITLLFISSVGWLSSWLLDNPYTFNYVRYLLAGKQIRMKKFIKKYIDEYNCTSVADICSGTGDFAELVPDNAMYIGWDLNKQFVDYAKQRYIGQKNKTFIKADVLTSKRFVSNRFDAVLLISTIHHFSDAELAILLPIVKKITKKVVIIADIIPDPPHLLQKFFARLDRGKYVRPANEKKKVLEKYFRVVKTQPIPTRSAVQYGIICEKK